MYTKIFIACLIFLILYLYNVHHKDDKKFEKDNEQTGAFSFMMVIVIGSIACTIFLVSRCTS